MMNLDWIDTLIITEEQSGNKKKNETVTLFYIREKPFKAGYSYQSTALTLNAAESVVTELKKYRNNYGQ